MNGNEQKQNRSSAFDAVLMVALVFSLFTLLCLITRSTLLGELGEVYANFVLGSLGFVSYAVMPIIACYSIFQLFSKKSVNSVIVLGCVVLYVLGATLIFHILTSSASDVFAGTMTYADYIDESYFLQADGLYNATAGGAVASAILYYILKNVGIVGANIFSMLIIALATFGVWILVRKMMPKKAKAPKIKKAKKVKTKKVKEKDVQSEEESEEYIEYSNAREPEFFEEQEAPQKRVNALGMEVINPTVGREYPDEMPKRDYNARIVKEEKPSKLHVVNIEDAATPAKRKKKPTTAQDILFNGSHASDHTVADHNRVRNLGEMNDVELEPQRFEAAIPTTQSSKFAELFGNQNTKPVQTSNNANAASNTNFFTKDYQITQSSEFGIIDNTIAPEQRKEEISKPFNDDEEINKKMYSKEMPVNPPKIWTMADLEAEKPKVSEETVGEIEEETVPAILSEEDQALEEARLHREKMDRLKSEMLSPADEKDIENLRQIYPNTNSVDYKRVQNPRIITSLSQLESQNEESNTPSQTNFSDLNRKDFIYDVKTDEFIDKESDVQIERLQEEQIKKSQTPSSSFGMISDIGDEENEEAPLKTTPVENENSYKSPIGFSKIEQEMPKPDEIYKRQNIANPMPISNVDGTRGEQLPIYSEEKVTFNHPYIYPPIDLLEDFEQMGEVDMEDVKRNAVLLEQVLENFNIPAKVMDMVVGPTVTKYELEMPQGIQVKRVEG
ncbi:MAG: DNA translocase FtsK, partial [Bacillota bacterium]